MTLNDNTASETELAFNLATGRVAIEKHHLFKDVEPTSQQLISTYFDTPGHTLARSGWSVRIRTNNKRQVLQTVKGPRVAATGPEYEVRIDSKELNFDRLMATPVWRVLGGQESELSPIFETRIARTTRNLHLQTATIEAAIDEGELRSFDAGRSHPIHDLELEKKSGDIGSLYRIAIELVLDTGMVIEPASKAERGYRLIDGDGPQSFKHQDVVFERDVTTVYCFHHVVSDIITHLRKNLHAARAGTVGGIHQLRVSLRRLRAALMLFKGVLRSDAVQIYDQEIGHFARIFGDARDWDVFLTSTLTEATTELPDAAWFGLVRYVAESKRAEAHAKVAEEIAGRRFNSLVLSVMGWSEDFVRVPKRVLTRAASDVIPDLLTGIADKVDTRRRNLDGSAEALHKLRKSMKKLRYGVEFFESLYPHKAVRRYLGPCKEMQEALGSINDVHVTGHLLGMLIADCPAVAPAAGELTAWLGTRQRKAERQVPKLLRHLRDDKPFWID